MTATNHAELQAKAQLDSIREMIAAVELDWDRLAELRDEKAELISAVEDAKTDLSAADDEDRDECQDAFDAAVEALESFDAEELAELEAAAGDCTDADDAQERIDQDPLSIEVRSDWSAIGSDLTPSEFCILLMTGGPAVRILGELDESGEPTRAYMQHQDWNTPWMDYYEPGIGDVLLSYARRFCFAS